MNDKVYIIFLENLDNHMIQDIKHLLVGNGSEIEHYENCFKVKKFNEKSMDVLDFWGVRYFLLE